MTAWVKRCVWLIKKVLSEIRVESKKRGVSCQKMNEQSLPITDRILWTKLYPIKSILDYIYNKKYNLLLVKFLLRFMANS